MKQRKAFSLKAFETQKEGAKGGFGALRAAALPYDDQSLF